MKLFRIAVLAIGLMSLAIGCRNTVRGAGQDIERMGDKIEDATD